MEKINTDCKQRTWKNLGKTFQGAEAVTYFEIKRELKLFVAFKAFTVVARHF